tara:strand:+ start:3587 stop:6052 length:2466 start_codon:yes stop_codon:yes gene_type:complete
MSWESVLKATGVGKDGMSEKAEEVKSQKAKVTEVDEEDSFGTPYKLSKNGPSLKWLLTSTLFTNRFKPIIDGWVENNTMPIEPNKDERRIPKNILIAQLNGINKILDRNNEVEILYMFSNYDIIAKDIPIIKSNMLYALSNVKKISATKKKEKTVQNIFENLSTKNQFTEEDVKSLMNGLKSKEFRSRVKRYITSPESKGVAKQTLVEVDAYMNNKNSSYVFMGIGYNTKNINIKLPEDAEMKKKFKTRLLSKKKGTYEAGSIEGEYKYKKGVVFEVKKDDSIDLPDFVNVRDIGKLIGGKPSNTITRTALGEIFDIPEFNTLTRTNDDNNPKEEIESNKTYNISRANRKNYLKFVITELRGEERNRFLPYMKTTKEDYAMQLYEIKSNPSSTGKYNATLNLILTHPTYSDQNFINPPSKESLQELKVIQNLNGKLTLDREKGTYSRDLQYLGNEEYQKIQDIYDKKFKVKRSGEIKDIPSRLNLRDTKAFIKEVEDAGLIASFNEMIGKEDGDKQYLQEEIVNELFKFHGVVYNPKEHKNTPYTGAMSEYIEDLEKAEKNTDPVAKENEILSAEEDFDEKADTLVKFLANFVDGDRTNDLESLVKNRALDEVILELMKNKTEEGYLIKSQQHIQMLNVFFTSGASEGQSKNKFDEYVTSLIAHDGALTTGEIRNAIYSPKQDTRKTKSDGDETGPDERQKSNTLFNKFNASFGSVVTFVSALANIKSDSSIKRALTSYIQMKSPKFATKQSNADAKKLISLEEIVKTKYDNLVREFYNDIDKTIEDVLNKEIKGVNREDGSPNTAIDPFTFLQRQNIGGV